MDFKDFKIFWEDFKTFLKDFYNILKIFLKILKYRFFFLLKYGFLYSEEKKFKFINKSCQKKTIYKWKKSNILVF